METRNIKRAMFTVVSENFTENILCIKCVLVLLFFGINRFGKKNEFVGEGHNVVLEFFIYQVSLQIELLVHKRYDQHVGTGNAEPAANLILHTKGGAHAPHSAFAGRCYTKYLFGLFREMVKQVAYCR